MKKQSFLISLASVAIMASACKQVEQVQQQKVVPVKVVKVAPQTLTGGRNYTGTVEESTAISLGFSSSGTVEQVFASEGQQVQKGQLLATLNSASAQNSYEAMQSKLHQAQDAYDRMAKLHDNGSLSDLKFEEVKSGLQQAKSMAAIARKSLDDCKLYAPRDGVIASRSAESGANIMPGTAAFKLVSVENVFVKISVPENEISTTIKGQEARVEVPALNSSKVFTGKIELKGITANPVSHTYEVKIGVANPRLELMPGMVCKVRLKIEGQTLGIVAPSLSVQVAHNGSRFVWLADGDTVKRRFVQTGAMGNLGVEIVSGLTVGELLVVEGCQKVSEGMRISVEHLRSVTQNVTQNMAQQAVAAKL
jgi:RND family efflux transporter MFP subunit